MPTILHIEDDPANRLLVRKLLVPAGFEVIDAVDGLDGIHKACELKPNLVLVDIAIPGLDGYEVTLRLRAEPSLRHVPIVAITAEGNRDTSLAVGCDGFLQKPIAARTFAATIQGFLDGRREPAGRASDEHLRAQSQRIVAHLEQKVAEISEANERLRELDQARREFYRNLSHELATPMTPIVGYVRLLADGELGDLTAPQLKAVRAVDECAQRLRGLIDNLLDVTAIETGRMRFAVREYDLVDTVRKALKRSQSNLVERRLRVATEIPEGLSGLGDAARLGRAISEMLDNACKFTPEGGAVGIRLRRIAPRQFELCIADTGPGVPRDAQLRLFEPFYQADGSVTRAYGGAGVGLAIARGVAQGHGGDVRVVSPTDEEIGGVRFAGAAFYFRVAENAERGGRSRSFVTSLPGNPQSSAGIYLDWNATTPPLPEVLAAMTAAASVAWGNPSSVHQAGRQARAVVEDSREAIARLCGSDPRDVLFTSGATEANNLALRAAPALVTSRLEHPSVIRVAELLERDGRPVVWLPVPPSGRLEAADVESAIRGMPSGFVVAVMAVNHETGVIQPLAAIAELVRKGGGRLHVDAVQAVGKLPAEVWSFGDTLSVGAHKIRGPKGIGALILRSPGVPQPVLVGGSQERGLRPGTVDPVAAAGFAVAARHAAQAGPDRYRELTTLRDRVEFALRQRAVVNGGGTLRAPHVTNLSVHDWRGDELVAALDLAGVQIASGSACSAGTAEPSPVITAMVGRDRAERAVRVSLGEETNTEQIDDAISVMTRIVRAQPSSA